MLLTGSTGFKGGWLALDLRRRGAQVTGYALDPAPGSLFERADLGPLLREDRRGDVRDCAAVGEAVTTTRPDVVFHLAAQPLVRASYADPMQTWSTNVIGTATVLDAIRALHPCPVVVVTSDKVYADGSKAGGNSEDDRLGGSDPYSASKAATELVAASYREAFGMDIATVRAGNVIGGGDIGADRLLPDLLRALESGRRLVVRSPEAMRPWHHVLDALAGYRTLAERLLTDDDPALRTAFNFGPATSPSVREVVEAALVYAGYAREGWELDDAPGPREAAELRVRSHRATAVLGWRPRWEWPEAVRRTVEWHRRTRGASPSEVRAACEADITAHHLWG